MSAPVRDGLEEISERLAGVLRRQDELDARFTRIEAALGLPPMPVPLAAAPSLAATPTPRTPRSRSTSSCPSRSRSA